MSQSSEDEDDVVLFANRPEWQDITPIPQHENITPVAPIFYTDEYRDATSYFRAVVKLKEHSQRVLDLTLHIIDTNPAHYTVWQYRWSTLMALYGPSSSKPDSSALLAEQTLMEDFAIRYLKFYQVWHHRRLLLLQLSNPLPELLFISNALQTDSKNYHTWAYRQWILTHFTSELGEDVWDGELMFVERMLEEDVRNNSAWHHRFFVVWHPGPPDNREEILRRELRYVKTKIALAPSNLSAWNYLRGILTRASTSMITLLPFVEPFTAPKFDPTARVGGALDLDNPGPGPGAELPCAYAVEFMADALAKECISSGEKDEKEREKQEKQAVDYYKRLATDLDPMRKSYWSYRIAQLTQLDRLQAQEAA